MQKTLQSVSGISFLFFVVLGGLHISTSLLLAEKILNSATTLIWNALDLPFLLAALLYGTSQFSLTLENVTGNLKIPFTLCSIAAAAAFGFALYINFGFPDANLF